MIELTKKEVDKLLKLIKNLEDRKVVRLYLQNLRNLKSGKKPRDETKQRGIAKQAADILIRVGLKIGEHVLIDEFLHLFD